MDIICFDLDGTLIDANKAHVAAFNKAFEKNGLRKVSNKKLIFLFGLVGRVLVKKLFPRLSQEDVTKVIKDHDYYLVKEMSKHAKQIKGVKGTLKKLKKRYKLALVSNCKHRTILALLRGAKLERKLFDIILGNDEVHKPKPYPDEILKAERLLHLKADYMVGDTVYDIVAGRKAKVKTIAVLTGVHSKSKLKKQKPYMILSSVNNLPEVI